MINGCIEITLFNTISQSFCFGVIDFSNKYISSLKNENEAGLGFIIGIILYGSQNKMKKNISELEQRTMKYFKL